MAEPILQAEGLVKQYGPVRALGRLDLSLDAGAWGLLGPNGAGKTTLLMMLLGLTTPTAGRARVLGMDPAVSPLEVRGRVGFVPEGEAFVPGYTGVGFVAFCGALAGMPSGDALGRAHEVLDYVGLGEARYRKVSEYSTGMRQRAKLAAALVHDPDLLILDEPTNGLDPDGRRDMLALLQDLSRHHGKAMIYASHVIPDIEEVCDRVLILEAGEARYQGPVRDLLALADRAYDVDVADATEAAADAMQKGGAAVSRNEDGTLRVVLPEAGREEIILRAVVASGARLRSLRAAGRHLEEGFASTLEAKR